MPDLLNVRKREKSMAAKKATKKKATKATGKSAKFDKGPKKGHGYKEQSIFNPPNERRVWIAGHYRSR